MKEKKKILRNQEEEKLEFPYLSKYAWLYIHTGTKSDISSFASALILIPSVIILTGVNLIGNYMKPIYIIVLSLIFDILYTLYWWKNALKRRELMESMRGKMDEYDETPNPEVIRKLLEKLDKSGTEDEEEEIIDKETRNQRYEAQCRRKECENIARQYRGEEFPFITTKF